MIDKKKAKILKSMYAKNASYLHIGEKIGESRKTVDNYIYRNGLSKGKKVGQRGGNGDHISMAPVHKLRKDQIVWMSKHFCKAHGKNFILHHDCYLKEHPEMNRVGSLDIETSGLNASFGIVLCYCILDHQTGEIYERLITKEEMRDGTFDRNVVAQCIKDLDNFDVLCTYFGTRFDNPFLRTRALIWNLNFPTFGQKKNLDVYYSVRAKTRLHRKSLEQACAILLGKTEKTAIDPKHWNKAIMQGDKDSLFFILDHCRRDVRDLKRLHDVLIDYRYPQLASI
ncbi:ribonuclease H-like domain-containing protein [Patescibacteria group bacterium]|nr:ribonuclease H-like domain-containing protein [Patescibacteria group bacterium]